VLVVEDVVTSGGQVVISTGDLRRLGAQVDHALCVIDRQEGGAAALAADGIKLRALLTRSDLS
jgi:orotate phosphoribosyltransferase